MTDVVDILRPSPDDALRAWARRVRANREQVDQFRETSPADFYAPIAGMFRADPRRRDEPALEVLRSLVRPGDTVLDIGAGGGRYALPLALVAHQVIALDPSEGMLAVLREGMAGHAIDNIQVVPGRWPPAAARQAPAGPNATGLPAARLEAAGSPATASSAARVDAASLEADVALISHLGYDVEDIGPFLDAMEAAARRVCVAVLLEQPPPTAADELWPAVHGVERATLPSLPEFLTLLLARGRLFEVQLVERPPQTFEDVSQALASFRGQLWTLPDSPKDRVLQNLLRDHLELRNARYARSWDPARVGIVTWHAT